jgi:hypothetical protein
MVRKLFFPAVIRAGFGRRPTRFRLVSGFREFGLVLSSRRSSLRVLDHKPQGQP